MVAIFAGIAQAQEDRIEADCRNLLHRSVFNCGCTAEFLENELRELGPQLFSQEYQGEFIDAEASAFSSELIEMALVDDFERFLAA